MVTGRTPFHDTTVHAIMRRVVDDEPAPPRRLQPKLPRDLETICLKCLEKVPARPYPTAEALGEDLDAFLDGRPISARATGTVERAWKWAARRPAVAALSLTTALSIVLGFAGVTWKWRAAEAAEQTAIAQRDRAIKAEAVTDAVNHFVLDDLLATATPEVQLGRKITVEEVLQNASARIDGRFADQPEFAASLRLVLGNSYRKLGKFELAARHLATGVDLRREYLGETHRDTLAAAADRGLLLADQHKWDEAIPLLRQVVGTARETVGPNDPLTIEATGRLALVLEERGDATEAEGLFKDSLAAARRSRGPTDPLTLTILNDYGMFLQARKQLPAAEAAFREAADGRAKALAPTHPATLESLSNLAVVLDNEGRWTEAKPLWTRLLEDKKKVLGREHIDTLSAMNNLADLLIRHNEPEAALPLFDEAYEGFRATLGADNPVTLRVQNNLGKFVFRLGQQTNRPDLRRRAETLLAAVLETRRRVLPPGHPDTLLSAHVLSSVLIVLNRLDEAEPLLKEALDGRRKTLGPGNLDTLETVTNYAQLLNRRQKRAEAVAQCREALAAAEKEGTAENPAAIVLLDLMVEMLARDRPVDALGPAERAVAVSRKVHGEAGDETWRARFNLGSVLLDVGRPADAEPHLRAVYDAYRAVKATSNQTIITGGRLGDCLLTEKRFEEAEPLLVTLLQALRGTKGAPKARVQSAGAQVVKLYDAWGKPEKAAEWREKLK